MSIFISKCNFYLEAVIKIGFSLKSDNTLSDDNPYYTFKNNNSVDRLLLKGSTDYGSYIGVIFTSHASYF